MLASESKLALGLSQIRKPVFVAGETKCEAEVLDWLTISLAAIREHVMWAVQLRFVAKCDSQFAVIGLVDIV